MARAPTVPPVSMPLVDKDGRLTQAWYKYLTGERDYSTNVNSGANQAIAEAAAAQATANAASATAQATQSNAFTVTVNRAVASVTITGGGLATTPNVTVTPSGGTPPYSHVWSKVSGDTFNVSAALSATTNFYETLPQGSYLTATYQDLVTDSLAATATIQVGVSAIDITF